MAAAWLALLFCSSVALAQPTPKTIQEALIWTGHYSGPLDGKLGKGSVAAIREYQTAMGEAPTGILTDAQKSSLLQRGEALKTAAGFANFVDDATGALMGFPAALAPEERIVDDGADFYSNDKSLVIGIRHYNCQTEITTVYNSLQQALGFTKIDYTAHRDDWFVISGSSQTKSYYLRFFSAPGGYTGMLAVYDAAQRERISPAIVMLSLTFKPSATTPSFRIRAAPPVDVIPIEGEIIADLKKPPVAETSALGTVAKQEVLATDAHRPNPPNAILNSNDHTQVSKLLLDSIQALISKSSAKRVRFYRYVVHKAELDGFRSDMPLLRVVFPERVFFDTDKSDVRTEAEPVLRSIALSLRKQVGKVALFVAGHTDSRGSEEYNLSLSIRRAESVARALAATGVGSTTIWRVGFGKDIPLRPNTSPQNMAYNRRVEFLIAQQPTVIAAWVKHTKSLCEAEPGTCGEPQIAMSFRAAAIGRPNIQPLILQLPARPWLQSPGSAPKERPPLPQIMLSRPSLQELE